MQNLTKKVKSLDSDPYVTLISDEARALRNEGIVIYGYHNVKTNILMHGYQEIFDILSDVTHPDNQGRLSQFQDQPDNPYHKLDWACITDGPQWLSLVMQYDPDALNEAQRASLNMTDPDPAEGNTYEASVEDYDTDADADAVDTFLDLSPGTIDPELVKQNTAVEQSRNRARTRKPRSG